MEVYVARQPIFKRNKKIYGYELLFRGGMANYFPDIDGDTATSRVLSNSFFTIGIENILGTRPAFINFTQGLLENRVPLLFPKERVVVEVLEDVEPEDGVIQACREIGEKGYSIALDDFFYRVKFDPLIALADTIKLDFIAMSMDEIGDTVKKLSCHDVNFLAEKVETYEEFDQAVKMGFQYFQGYFFSKPEIIQGRDISSPNMNLLEIMAEANREDFRFEDLEKLISRDVAISYKLMRYINSAYFRRVNDISSIRQAIVMLGEKRIRRFLSLIAMTTLASEKPVELIRTSIIRAKFCELLGGMNGSGADPSELFTLGLFSLIDAILDDSMEDLMGKLPLSETIKGALVKGEGALETYIRLASRYETGDWKGVSEACSTLKIDEEKLPGCYVECLGWADSLASM